MTTETGQPQTRDGTKLCIAVTRQGVTAYGNKAAFESLAEWFRWMASSAPSEHYECHTIMYLRDEASTFGEDTVKNVYVLFDANTRRPFEKKAKNEFGFELTFMMATESDLDKLAGFQTRGLLPKGWDSEPRIVVK